MRKDLKRKLDQLARKEKINTVAWISGFVALGLFLVAIYTPISRENRSGTLVSVSMRQTEWGSIPKVQVQIEDSHVVLATMSRRYPFIEGAKVDLLLEKSLVGKPKFRVIGIHE